MAPTIELRRPALRRSIKTALTDMIEAQGLAQGERIPSQLELATHFGTTEVTVHRALVELEREGIIHRVGGRGTFVGPEPTRSLLRSVCLVLPGEHLDEPTGNPLFWPYVRQLMHAFVVACGTERRFSTVAALGSGIPGSLRDLGAHDVVFFHHTKLPRDVFLQLIREGKVPIVAFGLPTPGVECLTVDGDPFTGLRRSVAHLVQRGYRRIAFAGASEDWGASWRDGYRQGLADFNIPFDEDLLVLSPGGQTQVAGHQNAAEFMRRGVSCDAMLVDADMRALGIIEYLQQEGVRIPRDIAVMGYDGLDNTLLQPPYLTSLRVPYETMVRSALAEIDQSSTVRSPVKHLSFCGEVAEGRTTPSRLHA